MATHVSKQTRETIVKELEVLFLNHFDPVEMREYLRVKYDLRRTTRWVYVARQGYLEKDEARRVDKMAKAVSGQLFRGRES